MTDIIVDRSPQHNDEFINKVADAMWLLMEQRVHKAVEEAIAAQSVKLDNDELDERIKDRLEMFSVEDMGFDLSDYSYDLDSMIDNQVQYQAEHGELKEWLGQEDDNFEDRVLNVLRTNTIRIEI
jgi:hypothetical protein